VAGTVFPPQLCKANILNNMFALQYGTGTSSTSTSTGQGATHHGGAGDVGASDDSLDSQEAPRKLHDNNGVLGVFRNAISGPEIGTMVALKTPHDVQKIFLVVWRGKV
jgi:hypothetical protein